MRSWWLYKKIKISCEGQFLINLILNDKIKKKKQKNFLGQLRLTYKPGTWVIRLKQLKRKQIIFLYKTSLST
jgi:hypothetical protein